MNEQQNWGLRFTEKKRAKFLIGIIAVLGAVMLLSGGIQHAAWSNGYLAGLSASGGEIATVAARSHHYGHGFGHGFGIIGGLFKLGILLLTFLFLAKMVGLLTWRHAGQGGGPAFKKRWAKHWPHGGHFTEKFRSEPHERDAAGGSEEEGDEPRDPADRFYV